MTDRAKGLTVVLEHDVRVDDAEALVNAIQQLRGVASVHTVIATADDFIVRQQVTHELRMKLWEILK